MSATATSWIAGHLVLASIGVTLLSTAALLVALACRRDPVACHRYLVAFLPVLLLVIPIQIAAPAVIDWPGGGAAIVAAQGWQAIVGRPLQDSPGTGGAIIAADAAAPFAAPATRRVRLDAITLLLAAYGTGCLLMLARRVQRIVETRRLLAGCEAVHSPAIIGLWRGAASPLRRRVRLLCSHELVAPACCGWWRPAVILPADTAGACDSTALRFALLHEVEHLRRRDWLAAAAQSLVVTLYWFHPMIWLYSRALDQQRELSCDALVIRRTGQRRGYALALIDYCERLTHGRSPHPRRLLALGSLTSLSRRIHMITRTSPAPTPIHNVLAFAVSVTCAAAAIAAHASVAAAAQDKSTPAEPDAIAMKTLKEEGGVITSVQVDATIGGQDPMEVIRASQMHGHGITEGWITMQETLASAPKAVVKDNVLLADTFNMNLPEGSKLKAVLSGSRIETAGLEGKTRITIERGKIELFDEQGVKRVSLRTEPADATFTVEASMEAGEVAFIATTATRGAKLRLEFDRTTGVPAGEKQPPHGAVRYELQPAGNDEDARTRLKIQWIYDVEQVFRDQAAGRSER